MPSKLYGAPRPVVCEVLKVRRVNRA